MQTCTVKYEFRTEDPTQLNLDPDEVLIVLKNDDEHWWYGEKLEEAEVRGWFPASYVEARLLSQEEANQSTLDPDNTTTAGTEEEQTEGDPEEKVFVVDPTVEEKRVAIERRLQMQVHELQKKLARELVSAKEKARKSRHEFESLAQIKNDIEEELVAAKKQVRHLQREAKRNVSKPPSPVVSPSSSSPVLDNTKLERSLHKCDLMKAETELMYSCSKELRLACLHGVSQTDPKREKVEKALDKFHQYLNGQLENIIALRETLSSSLVASSPPVNASKGSGADPPNMLLSPTMRAMKMAQRPRGLTQDELDNAQDMIKSLQPKPNQTPPPAPGTKPKGHLRGNTIEFTEQERGNVLKRVFGKTSKGSMSLMTFSKDPLKHAILKKNKNIDDACAELFRSVAGYMGDRKSRKTPFELATKVIGTAMVGPDGLHDEAYLQILKQINGNPGKESTRRGWNLLLLCLACFPPSDSTSKYMLQYMQRQTASKQATGETKEYASTAVRHIQLARTLGKRSQIPTQTEYTSITSGVPIRVKVYMVNGSYHEIEVNSFTKVEDLRVLVHKKMNVEFTSPFRILQEDTELRDPVCSEHIVPLSKRDRVVDILAVWEAQEGATTRTTSGTDTNTTMFPGASSLVNATSSNRFRFIYKAALIIRTDHTAVRHDRVAMQMYFDHCVEAILNRSLRVDKDKLMILAALLLHAKFPKMVKNSKIWKKSGWLDDNLHELLPPYVIQTSADREKACVQIMWELSKLAEEDEGVELANPIIAMIAYIDLIQDEPLYGAQFFRVEQRQFPKLPPQLLMAVTHSAVHLVHEDSFVIGQSFAYDAVATWGQSLNKFIMVVGDTSQQRKLVFKCKHANQINRLMHDYMKLKHAEMMELTSLSSLNDALSSQLASPTNQSNGAPPLHRESSFAFALNSDDVSISSRSSPVQSRKSSFIDDRSTVDSVESEHKG